MSEMRKMKWSYMTKSMLETAMRPRSEGRETGSEHVITSGPTSWTVKNRSTGELFAGYDAEGDARWTDNKDDAVVFREYRSAEEVATMYGAVMEGQR